MRHILVENQALYTPVRRYRRGNEEVTVIGMCHISRPEYFVNIQAEIDRHEHGFFEQIRKDSGKFKVPEENQLYFKFLKTLKTKYSVMSRLGGMAHQGSLIIYPDNWQNADMSVDEIAAKASEEMIKATPGMRRSTLGMYIQLKKDPAAFARMYKSNGMLHAWIFESGLFQKDNDNVIMSGREKRLFSLMDPALHEGVDDIGVTYGAGHLSSIDAYLRQKGFKREGCRWEKAWEITDDEPGYVASLWRLFNLWRELRKRK